MFCFCDNLLFTAKMLTISKKFIVEEIKIILENENVTEFLEELLVR